MAQQDHAKFYALLNKANSTRDSSRAPLIVGLACWVVGGLFLEGHNAVSLLLVSLILQVVACVRLFKAWQLLKKAEKYL
ncbi:hypothetical protein C4564_01835 [Candidatus Microgenomates bacterium]|nr:MAG: hypothetical protein C4564_01835 [Candidatus Microgenomates bacterium]